MSLCRPHRRSILQGKSTPGGRQRGFGGSLFIAFFQNVFVCTLSNRYSGWSASGNPVDISDAGSCRKQNNIGRYKAMSYQFWGWEHADAPAITEEYPGIHNPRQLYDALSKLWCADTCAPRMRKD